MHSLISVTIPVTLFATIYHHSQSDIRVTIGLHHIVQGKWAAILKLAGYLDSNKLKESNRLRKSGGSGWLDDLYKDVDLELLEYVYQLVQGDAPDFLDILNNPQEIKKLVNFAGKLFNVDVSLVNQTVDLMVHLIKSDDLTSSSNIEALIGLLKKVIPKRSAELDRAKSVVLTAKRLPITGACGLALKCSDT